MDSKNHRRKYSVDAAAFAERLNRLFAVVYPPGRGPYRSVEVMEALARRGYRLSAPYVSQLRSGTRISPSPRTVEMLAEFFGIRAEYFDSNTGYARALDVELDWLHLAHDETVRDLTTALMTLTPSLRDELLGPTTAMSQNNRGFSAPAVEGRQERLSAEQLEKTSPPSLDDYPIIKCGR